MPRVTRDGIEIEYETTGDPADPALVLVNGLGQQLTGWDADLIDAFVDRGFFVVRPDNRDVGLSTHVDRRVDISAAVMAVFAGHHADVPYLLADLADDLLAVLDHAGVERAHLFGLSMGGMIAQAFALAYPERVATLTSVMSTTGDPDVGQPDPEVLPFLLEPGPLDRAGAVEHQVAMFRAIGSPDRFEEDRVRARAERAYDRAFDPRGVGRQLLAILASGSRTDQLRTLAVPTLVIHGDQDRLINVSGGQRTAEVIPGAHLLILEGMGHDLPTYYWATIVEAVTRLASGAAATA